MSYQNNTQFKNNSQCNFNNNSQNNFGSSNNLIYDECEYDMKLHESTAPLSYQMYDGKYENCSKCIKGNFYRPYDLVDIDSELKNRNRPLSNCPKYKYNPNCQKSKMCISTFDKNLPVIQNTLCPVVTSNIPRVRDVGYRINNNNICNF